MFFFPCFFPGLCFQDSVKRARQRRLLAPRAAARPATSRSSRSSTKGPWMWPRCSLGFSLIFHVPDSFSWDELITKLWCLDGRNAGEEWDEQPFNIEKCDEHHEWNCFCCFKYLEYSWRASNFQCNPWLGPGLPGYSVVLCPCKSHLLFRRLHYFIHTEHGQVA